MPKDEFDAYSDNYTETVEKSISFSGLSHDFFQQSKALMIQDLLQMNLPGRTDLRLLDVGCGIGALHPLLSSLFDQIAGTDVSADSIERARVDNPANLYAAYDGHRLPYDDNSFDMSLAICVMHHVPPAQWENFLAELARVVVPGGLVCLIEHNKINPATRLSVARCPFDADAVLVGQHDMRRRMRKAALGQVGTRNFVFFPSNAPMALKVSRYLHWLPLGGQYAAVGRV